VLAEAVGIPDVVIRRGREYLGDRHDELEQSITAMQTFRAEAEQAYRQAAEQAHKAERARADYEERLTAIKQQRTKLMQEARAEAADIIQHSRSLVENTIREIREQERSTAEVKKTFEQGRSDLLAAIAAEQPIETPEASGEEQITVGMTVTIDGTSTVGTVLLIDKAKNVSTVEVNGIKFTVPLSSLRAGGSVRKERRDEVFMKFDSRTSCDLRGKRVDEAIKDLEYFVSDAILGGLSSATIIHGKGTGALRKAVQELFSEHPHIRSYRPGLIEEGGDGVTIVEII
jgi:DNA mismatch repair protein MutS2